ncbi:MAG: (2Fe-2S)-binding protein [Chloroflexi bacterium]|nr:(2Fe-2S)-binding protein [Chloroflexota bacterium]
MYVCLCKGLTESDVEACVRAGSTTPEALIAALGLDGDDTCGRCAREIDCLLPDAPSLQPSLQSIQPVQAGQAAPLLGWRAAPVRGRMLPVLQSHALAYGGAGPA